ncbi:uncharacterized protein PRCAT00001235001 [Priceomyces carsonii]|uniref:uncharacterized protein n=1 Tax=Priceomyces carsonii TaxID=28549 RepID=UPI002EDA1150|nr:unnamed protein product [Priceomyces carsonii]
MAPRSGRVAPTLYDSEYYDTLASEIQEKYVDQLFNLKDKDFEILSTMRYDPKLTTVPPVTVNDITKENFFLFDEHYHRLVFTLQYFQLQLNGSTSLEFDIPYDFLWNKLTEAIRESKKQVYEPMKIRLLVSLEGQVNIEIYETTYRNNLLDGFNETSSDQIWDVFIDLEPCLVSPFTSFKTTNRDAYNKARERCLPGKKPGKEEVLLVNTQGHLMEGSISNVAIRRKEDNIWVTPQLSCGCLCGVMRHFLLRKGFLEEQTLHAEDLGPGSEVLLFNGVMGVVKGIVK